jgi:hypothetical protein
MQNSDDLSFFGISNEPVIGKNRSCQNGLRRLSECNTDAELLLKLTEVIVPISGAVFGGDSGHC